MPDKTLFAATALAVAMGMACAPVSTSAAPPPPATAASAARAAPADPADPRTQVPAVAHRSVLAGARRGVAAPATPAPWRDANDATNRVGGWRTYAREPIPAEAKP